MSDGKPSMRSASYLSPPDFHRLNWACRMRNPMGVRRTPSILT